MQSLDSTNIILTERDIELFRFLNEQKFMTAIQLCRIFWPHCDPRTGAARQRLKKLLAAGYIRIRVIAGNRRQYRLFVLTERGIEALRQRGMDHGFSEIGQIRPFFIDHTLKLVNIRAVFRGLGQADWQSERIIRKQCLLRGWYPDAILTVNGLKIAIEFENSLRSKRRFIDRIRRYANECEFELVLFVLVTPHGMGWMLDLDYPMHKISFVLYEDLMNKKGNSVLENRASKIYLSSIL